MSHPCRLLWIIGLALAVPFNGHTEDSSVDDPFASPPEKSAKHSEKDVALEGGGFITPHKQWNIPEDRWPQIDPPTVFNRHFQRPTKVWHIEPGYFAAFDAGEFGAGLFYSPGTGHDWIRVADTHVQDLRYFNDDRVLAVGGIAHLTYSGGAAFLIDRKSNGTWRARKVFASGFGIPKLWGDYSAPLDGGEKDYATIRLKLTLESPGGMGPTFAITSKGTTYYLGVEDQIKSSQDAADQPATAVESKAEDNSNPKPESGVRPQ